MSHQSASCCKPAAEFNAAAASAVQSNSAQSHPAASNSNSNGAGSESAAAKVFVPQVDIVESESQILLVADLPGVDQQGLDVSLEKNVLTIRGTVSSQAPEGYQLAYAEYDVGNFERAFTVSNDIDRQGIEAVLKDGVLKLTLPKAKHAVLQKIAVKTA